MADDKKERSFTPPPAGLKTWRVSHSWYNDRWNCGPVYSGKSDVVPAGQVLVGYINDYDPGSGPLPCEWNTKIDYRGTIWFDLREIFDKPSQIAEQATLKFRRVPGGVAAYDDARRPISRLCEDKLFVASADWIKDCPASTWCPRINTHVPTGDLIMAIDECTDGCSIDVTRQVNDWINGKAGRYGFVIVGEDENWLDKLIPHDKSVCETRYGDFSLDVTYRSALLTITLPLPKKPDTPVGRPPGPIGGALDTRKNVALAANGATADAQKFTENGVVPGLFFQPSFAIDGLRHTNAAGGDYWRDEHGLPSWLEVDFHHLKTIDEIDVITIQVPGYDTGADPSESDPKSFTSQGAENFEVKYWTGSTWERVPNGFIIGNTLAFRRITFLPSTKTIKTSKIRVYVNDSSDKTARIVELEAWGS
jgi:hypothetical protein